MNFFLATHPLYTDYLISDNYKRDVLQFCSIYDFKDIAFDYHCEKENAIKTFKTEVVDGRVRLNDMVRGDIVPDWNLKEGKLNFAFKCSGECQSCKSYHVHFLLHVFHAIDEKSNEVIKVQKVGVSPKLSVKPRKEIVKFFDRESNTWYYKGINSIADNYGIGALSYFRRIIEKELIHIIEDIKGLPDSHTLEIQSLLNEHIKNPSVSTIYDNIFQYLPNSLKSLGENPIKLLYNQTSEGLHSLTEDVAMDKAKIILSLLEFVILKMNEERSSIKNLRDAIKSLKNRF